LSQKFKNKHPVLKEKSKNIAEIIIMKDKDRYYTSVWHTSTGASEIQRENRYAETSGFFPIRAIELCRNSNNTDYGNPNLTHQ